MTMDTAHTELAAIDTALGALEQLDHAGRCRAVAYLSSALGVEAEIDLARALNEAEAQGLITSV